MITKKLQTVCLTTVVVFIVPYMLFAAPESLPELSVDRADQTYLLAGRW